MAARNSPAEARGRSALLGLGGSLRLPPDHNERQPRAKRGCPTPQCDELPLSPDPESVCAKSGGEWAGLGRDLDDLPLLGHRARLLD